MPARQIIARARAGSGEGRVNFKTAVDRALRQIAGAGFTVEYWDGERVDYGSGKPRFMLLVKTASVARGILRNPLVRLPEAYVDGDIELQGNLLDLLEFCYQSDEAFLNFSAWQRGAAQTLVVAATQLRGRGAPQRFPSLRSRQRILCDLARSPDGVFGRLLQKRR